MEAASTNERLALIIGALAFAADKHRDQRRKGADQQPYTNHSGRGQISWIPRNGTPSATASSPTGPAR